MIFDNFYTPDPQLGYGFLEGPDFQTRTLTRRTLPVTRAGFADPRQSLHIAHVIPISSCLSPKQLSILYLDYYTR